MVVSRFVNIDVMMLVMVPAWTCGIMAVPVFMNNNMVILVMGELRSP
jgi:hypothetical protein